MDTHNSLFATTSIIYVNDILWIRYNKYVAIEICADDTDDILGSSGSYIWITESKKSNGSIIRLLIEEFN